MAAYQFSAWQAKVQMTNQGDFYQAQIAQDATGLLSRLTECARVTCESCLNNTSGNALDLASTNHLLVLAGFAGDNASLLDNTDEVKLLDAAGGRVLRRSRMHPCTSVRAGITAVLMSPRPRRCLQVGGEITRQSVAGFYLLIIRPEDTISSGRLIKRGIVIYGYKVRWIYL